MVNLIDYLDIKFNDIIKSDNGNLKKNVYSVYCIQNKNNGKKYIGFSSNVKKRWKTEISVAFSPTSPDRSCLLSLAFTKYAKDKKYIDDHFIFSIIEEYSDLEIGLMAEAFWIDFYKTDISRFGKDAGYNMQPGGKRTTFGHKFDDEYKEKLSKMRRGENGSTAKLTWDFVKKIREEYVLGNTSYVKLGAKYDVDQSSIALIIKNRIWCDENYDHSAIKKLKSHMILKSYPEPTLDDAIKIRKEYNENDLIIDEISKKYNFSAATVTKIIKNKIFEDKNYEYSELTKEIVKEIRKEYSGGGISSYKLAEKYEVSRATIRNIINNKTWKDENNIIERAKLEELKKENLINAATMTWDSVNDIRCDYNNTDINFDTAIKKNVSKYNVSKGCIYSILTNRTWYDKNYEAKKLEPSNSKLTKEDVINIRSDYNDKMSRDDISRKYNISKSNICCIVNNKTWIVNE
jgi:Mor family transcriptional regulator